VRDALVSRGVAENRLAPVLVERPTLRAEHVDVLDIQQILDPPE
jgi:hypothetical protein